MDSWLALLTDLFEAVPNFSEGRDPAVMRAIAGAASVPGVHALDAHGDLDHNRLVLSLAAVGPEQLAAGLLAAVAEAVERIDLRTHAGVHPRVGAADVVPIVPLDGTPLADCVEVAHALGERVWSELRVPVFYYGGAALRPETRRLAEIRGGALLPDLGGPRLHPSAGAVCIGARPPLVAFNVILPGATLDEGAAVARALRESSGGLHGLQALAFSLADGSVQLSMNLVDLDAAPPALAMEALRAVAADLRIEVGAQEVVGLCPARVALPAASGRVLEGRLAAAAASAAAGACRRRGGGERELLAARLESEATELAALAADPDALLAGAERAAALPRVLRAAGVVEAELDRLLNAAARGLRAAAPAGRHVERVAALDRWLGDDRPPTLPSPRGRGEEN
jgi:glutamate formiminotransferase